MELKVQNKEELLKKYIDIFSALYVSTKNWLTEKEKEYFVALILLNSEGVDLSSKKAVFELETTYGFKNKGVYIYRLKLKEKGWIIQTQSGLDIPIAFKLKSIPKLFSFDFKIKIDGQ
jgi:hypothetical protein